MSNRIDGPPCVEENGEWTIRELYREDTGDPAGSYYENSVHVTAEGLIGMSVGGRVFVRPIADWHRLGGGAEGGLREARKAAAARYVSVHYVPGRSQRGGREVRALQWVAAVMHALADHIQQRAREARQ